MKNITLLKVPFHEKDEAKTLGAKWNPNHKSWYIPSGVDKDDFKQWIPGYKEDGDELSLSDLLFMVGSEVKRKFSGSYWVKAEVANISHKRHVYLDLVEFSGGVEIAKIRGMVWDQNMSILDDFSKSTGGSLENGIKVLINCTLDFHPQFGLSFNIIGIDPSYTIGSMQVKINEIISELKVNGIINKNRELASPLDFTKVAVLSPDGAAGLGDFKAGSEVLENNGVCCFKYYSSVFQGLMTSDSISSSLSAIYLDNAIENFDCIVIIRGGGSKTDLHFLNDYGIAEAILASPIPVLCGIGHEQDNTVIDLVSRMSFDTPSKVLSHIINLISYNSLGASDHYFKIRGKALEAVLVSGQVISSRIENIKSACSNLVYKSEQGIKNLQSEYANSVSALLAYQTNHLNLRMMNLVDDSYAICKDHTNSIKNNMTNVLRNNPISVLDKGFAIIKVDEKCIVNLGEIKAGSEIEISMKTGVTKVTKK